MLDKINVNLRNSRYLNQWKNTQEVIDYFKGIDNKQYYVGTMDCQYLRAVVVHNWKRLRNSYKKYFRTMV